jgi:hypothetical protein
VIVMAANDPGKPKSRAKSAAEEMKEKKKQQREEKKEAKAKEKAEMKEKKDQGKEEKKVAKQQEKEKKAADAEEKKTAAAATAKKKPKARPFDHDETAELVRKRLEMKMQFDARGRNAEKMDLWGVVSVAMANKNNKYHATRLFPSPPRTRVSVASLVFLFKMEPQRDAMEGEVG